MISYIWVFVQGSGEIVWISLMNTSSAFPCWSLPLELNLNWRKASYTRRRCQTKWWHTCQSLQFLQSDPEEYLLWNTGLGTTIPWFSPEAHNSSLAKPTFLMISTANDRVRCVEALCTFESCLENRYWKKDRVLIVQINNVYSHTLI